MRMRRPRSLRTRLVVSAVILIALVCAVVGSVTAVALRSYLYEQLDTKLSAMAKRAAGPPADDGRRQSGGSADDPLRDFLEGPGQEIGTVAAALTASGIEEAVVSEKSGDTETVVAVLDDAQKSALASVQWDGEVHTIDLPGMGKYRVQYEEGVHGEFLVAVTTAYVDSTVRTLIVIELCVTGAGLIAAGIAGACMVGIALRPLRRVAATATRVSELPLHSGEPALHERVPDTDPRTEIGQVGAAFNRMLDHVHSALSARQESETRVRQFVADASHELRTPLTSIRGYAELTRRGREETGPDTRYALGRIESEATRMTGLVEDLLLLTRLNNGRPLSYETTDLSPLLVDAVGDAGAAGRDHDWRVEVPDEPVLVRADAARMHQVLVNLLANARTHTPPGTTVTARVQVQEPCVRLEVEDNGPGIPAELLPRAFERFARGDASRSRAAGSTGLGLAIVRAVVTAHGGNVWAESGPGRTVFVVQLPTDNSDPAHPGDGQKATTPLAGPPA